MAEQESVVGVRLDAEHMALLDAACKVERLKRSDVLRRAIRAYADQLGVTVSKQRGKRGSRSR